ncbi:hypothetical protein NP493_664g02049 [Ridgeia piscesae]|uniref:Uncharacterized protein n=1 Tax=Ridgeia piscesae TaxID=27915 RepID=A0AAD9KS98_RIDPI|nr:hypothetical protein NP493_664g02049 [Ridgeia piscesae]
MPSRTCRSDTRKKFRKKHDSVDHESPDTKRQKRDSSEHRDEKQKDTMSKTVVSDTLVANDPRCDFCLLTSSSNKAGVPEDLLFCKDCQAKAHPSCMDYSEELAARAKNSPWQCIDCKTCFICEDSGDPDAMLFCDACDKGYHMNCHKPPIKEKPTGKWVCSGCEAELGLSPADTTDEHLTIPTDNNTDGGGPSCLPTPSDSPVHFLDEHKAEPTKDTLSSTVLKDSLSTLPKLGKTLSASVPDASDWTIDNVVEFFTDVGFTEQAQQFREQEIDGKSLLLMKRSDVLMGLALRLGPALKIYAHVERLQTRGDTLL